MKRRWFGMLALLSLLVAIAAIGAWAVAISHSPPMPSVALGDLRVITSRPGVFIAYATLISFTEDPDTPNGKDDESRRAAIEIHRQALAELLPAGDAARRQWSGPWWDRRRISIGGRWDSSLWSCRTVLLPHWLTIWPALLLPLIWTTRRGVQWRRERRRRNAGCCVRCGYDLRATPERCPECGHVPAEAAR